MGGYCVPNYNVLNYAKGPRIHLCKTWCFVPNFQQPTRRRGRHGEGFLGFVVDALFIARLNILGTNLDIRGSHTHTNLSLALPSEVI